LTARLQIYELPPAEECPSSLANETTQKISEEVQRNVTEKFRDEA
jgi:hypothetical protein